MFNFRKKRQREARIETKLISADRITPIKVLTQTGAVALLESAHIEKGKSRYSIMILKEAFTLVKHRGRIILKSPEGKKFLIKGNRGDFLNVLKIFRMRSPENKDLFEFPIPLGGVGYLGYEFFEEIEEIDLEDKPGEPDIYQSAFIFGRTFLIFDHLHDQALLAAASYKGELENIDLKKEIEDTEESLRRTANDAYKEAVFEEKISVIKHSKEDKKDFISKVSKIREEIIKGNLLQCVISRRVEVETDIDPLTAYRNLRMKNPSPYMLFLDFKSFKLFGASPEMMVKVKDGEVKVKPIAGTRRRGITKKEDEKLEIELVNDEKEKAEHLMLIDLGRNDVGKVSIGGSVEVSGMMSVERYSNVMHLVSDVKGKLAQGKTAEEAIKATFPAGTVTGAPKIQAVKTIEELEVHKRGPYAGLVGYFEKDGSFDSCIVIRCAVFKDKKMWVQAGAGIVYDSIPEKEYEETENKMAAMLSAIGIVRDEEKQK